MALQLVLTFAHVHAPRLAQEDQQISSTARGSGGSHSDHGTPNGLADLDCPICALINLSAAAAPSVAPALPLPALAEFVTLEPRAEVATAASPRTSQQARAPPAA